ncbi:MAG: hypothetical protein WC895_01920 [Candidatus Shapirobacteria bacterium]|jgi:hypothetical protein
MFAESSPNQRSSELKKIIDDFMSINYSDTSQITQKHLDSVKGNPNAPTRQYLGLMRTTEEEYSHRDEILRRPLP